MYITDIQYILFNIYKLYFITYYNLNNTYYNLNRIYIINDIILNYKKILKYIVRTKYSNLIGKYENKSI
jgi:hypothetical protein